MPPPTIDDQLWELINPLLPQPTRRYRHPGRRRLDDRLVLSGILFVLKGMNRPTGDLVRMGCWPSEAAGSL